MESASPTRNFGMEKDSIILSTRLSNFTPGIPDDLSLPGDFWWLQDGRMIYSAPEDQPNTRNSNLWQIMVDSKSDKPHGQPRRITNLAGFHMDAFTVTGDGRKLVFESGADQSHVYVGRLEAGGKLRDP